MTEKSLKITSTLKSAAESLCDLEKYLKFFLTGFMRPANEDQELLCLYLVQHQIKAQ